MKAVPGGEPGVTFQTVFRLYELYIYIYIFNILYICSYILYAFEGIDIISHLQTESPIVERKNPFAKHHF